MRTRTCVVYSTALVLLLVCTQLRETSGFEALLRVDRSAGDAAERLVNNEMLVDGSVAVLGQANDYATMVGIRFADVDIPHGAVVSNAQLRLKARTSVNVDPCQFSIQAEATNNAGPIGESPRNLSSRAYSDTSVTWSPGEWVAGARGPNEATPDISAILTEVFGRTGWENGNAFLLIITGEGKRQMDTYEGGGPPTLYFEYTIANVPEFDAGVLYETTIDVTVDNDVSESIATGSVENARSELTLGYDIDKGNQVTGLRFPNIEIPNGALILDAYIQFTAAEATAVQADCDLIVLVEDADNSEHWVHYPYDVSSRPTNPIYNASWDVPMWPIAPKRSEKQRAQGMSGMLQATIDREGWVYGNAISFMLSGFGRRVVYSAEAVVADTVTVPSLVVQFMIPEPSSSSSSTSALPPPPPPPLPADAVTLTVSVSAGTDDVEERTDTGHLYVDSTDLELVQDAQRGEQMIGLRFANLDIPYGSEILAASLQFTTDEVSTGACELVVYAERTYDAVSFNGDHYYDVSSRKRSLAKVVWVPKHWSVEGEAGWKQQVSVLAPTAEVLGLDGWRSGHSLAFIVEGEGLRTARAFEFGGTDSAPALTVSYIPPPSSSSTLPPPGPPPPPPVPYAPPPPPITNPPPPPPPLSDGQVQANGVIAAKSDDAEQALFNGQVQIYNEQMSVVFRAGRVEEIVALRFTGLSIPRGSAVESAWLDVLPSADSTGTGPCHLILEGEASSDSLTWDRTLYGISSRLRTNASAEWSPYAWTADVSDWTTRASGLEAIVAELVALPQWSVDSAVTLFLTGECNRAIYTYDADATKAATLTVRYTPPTVPPPPVLPPPPPPPPVPALPPPPPAPYAGAVTTTVRVSHDSDDGEEEINTGDVKLSSSDLEMCFDSDKHRDQLVGLRFRGIDIPTGSKVVSGHLTFTTDEVSSGGANLFVYAESTPDSAAFSNDDYDLSSRRHTVANVTWTPPAWNEKDESGWKQTTPDLHAPLAEVLEKGKWQEGNSLSLFVVGAGTRTAVAHDGSSSKAALLSITYTPPPPAPPPPPPAGSVTLTLEIYGDADDAEEQVSNGRVRLNSADIEMCDDPAHGPQIAGFRFRELGVPAGSTLLSSYLYFTASAESTEPAALTIYGDDTDWSARFVDEEYNLSGRKATNAKVEWEPLAWRHKGQHKYAQRTPDLSPIINEIMAHSNWESTSPISFLVSGSGNRPATSHDTNPAKSATLVVTYMPPAPPPPSPPPPPPPVPSDAVVLSYRIGSADDDGEEDTSDGHVSLTSTDLELVTDVDKDRSQLVALRFDAVHVHKGSTVLSASIQFACDEATAGPADLVVYAEAVGNSAPLAATDYDLSSRVATRQNVSWTPPPWLEVGRADRAESVSGLAPLIQEVVELDDWVHGNALTFFVTGNPQSIRVAEAYDGEPDLAAKLTITLIPPPPSTSGTDTAAATTTTVATATTQPALPPPPPPPLPSDGTTTTVQISDGADDVEERAANGNVRVDSSDIELVDEGPRPMIVGLRFPGLAVPRGADVVAAWVQFTTDEVSTGPCSLTIYADKNTDSPPWGTSNGAVSMRHKSYEFVNWEPAGWDTEGEASWKQRKGISPLVQEIIDQSGWRAGSAFSLIIVGEGTRVAEAYEGDPTAAATLVVEWLPPPDSMLTHTSSSTSEEVFTSSSTSTSASTSTSSSTSTSESTSTSSSSSSSSSTSSTTMSPPTTTPTTTSNFVNPPPLVETSATEPEPAAHWEPQALIDLGVPEMTNGEFVGASIIALFVLWGVCCCFCCLGRAICCRKSQPQRYAIMLDEDDEEFDNVGTGIGDGGGDGGWREREVARPRGYDPEAGLLARRGSDSGSSNSLLTTSHEANTILARGSTTPVISPHSFAATFAATTSDDVRIELSVLREDQPSLPDSAFRDAVAVFSHNIAGATHDNIVSPVFLCDAPRCVAMAFQPPPTARLHDVLFGSGAVGLSPARRMEMSAQIARGLAFLHRHSVSHTLLQTRTVVVVGSARSGGTVKLTDYGPTSMLDVPSYIVTKDVEFTAPEWFRGTVSGVHDEMRADVYSFAAVLYALWAGLVPYSHETPESLGQIFMSDPSHRPIIPLDAGVPDAVKTLIASCWATDPAERPSMAAVVDELAQIAASTPLPRIATAPSRASGSANKSGRRGGGVAASAKESGSGKKSYRVKAKASGSVGGGGSGGSGGGGGGAKPAAVSAAALLDAPPPSGSASKKSTPAAGAGAGAGAAVGAGDKKKEVSPTESLLDSGLF